MHVELYHTTTELKQLFRKEKDSRLAVRIRAVYLALMGKTASEIADVLGYSRRMIQKWIYSYNRHGLGGLSDDSGRGNKSKLNNEQIQWLRQRIEEGPRPEDGICVFYAGDIQAIIKKQFNVDYHVRSVRKLLKKLGYSWVSSRPNPKGDTAAREEFKKKSVIRSGKSVLIILERS